ncbi:MAG: hypothetical protein JO198_09515 [Candidatus Dormibacteraeota bacterium]|nr:hypothetical protein [Candidatus Dormibacteraeota bacterium]
MPGGRHVARRALVVAAAAGLAGMGVIPRWDAGATGIASQSFTGSTAPGWVLGGSATLTGGNVDPAGNGWLRLTDTGPSAETGYAYDDTAFPSAPGVSLSFDYASWGGTGADGTSLFLWDGSMPFSVGQSGGSLGYANGCGTPGAMGGYVGIGLDEYGNYANVNDNCHNGGDGTVWQPFNMQVGVRGSAAGGYAWLTGSGILPSSEQLAFPFANTRPDQTGAMFRHVSLTISPAGILNVQVQFGAGTTPVSVISGYNLAAQAAPPATYKLAFVGSTGAINDFHELRNLTLTDYEGTTAAGTGFSVAEGSTYNGPVATVTDPDPGAMASEYSASINWGDGSTTQGSIAGPTGGPFTVSGSHVYADEGSFTPVVSISDLDDTTNTASATDSVAVTDAALNATGNPAILQTSNLALSGTQVASFTDANPGATSADYTAAINWGDGSSSQGVVSGPTGGPFVVKGSHTYSVLGPQTISVAISDDGGSTANAVSQALLFADLGHGSFVIGNNNAGIGTPVMFWGSQWAQHNSFSQRSFPGHFLGFENVRTLPACNGAWVGIVNPHLAAPPASVPTYMAVISTSSTFSVGPLSLGNIAHVVIVKTDPGYAADPSHAGTGTVVGTVC